MTAKQPLRTMGAQAAWATPIFFATSSNIIHDLGRHVAMGQGEAEGLRFSPGGAAWLAQAGKFAHFTGAADT